MSTKVFIAEGGGAAQRSRDERSSLHKKPVKYISLDMKVFRVFKKVVWWALAAALCLSCAFFVFPNLPYGQAKEEKEETKVIRIWNVDTFEGGKGSRTAFLSRLATEFEKREKGVLCMVSSKTIEGLTQSLTSGDVPDLISFGVGAGFVGDYCRGEVTAWCRGVYALYGKTEDFSAISAKNCVLSKGGENLPVVAAAMHNLSGEFAVEDATTAYVRFLNGEYKYLLGTQRDACRFASRGVTVHCQPLFAYSDLYGYIGVTTRSPQNVETCQAYVDYLTSRSKQEELTRLGLFSPYFSLYGAAEGAYSAMEGVSIETTAHPFVSSSALLEMNEAARQVLQGENVKELKKFLKFL